MKTTHLKLIIVLLVLMSCQKIERNNPFDSECPKEIWTPTSFQAVPTSKGIELTWDMVDKNISGYKLSRQINTGTISNLTILPKDSTRYIDNDIILGEIHSYSLVAFAGNNESTIRTAELRPMFLVTTLRASSIRSNSAILGGSIIAADGVNIKSRGVTWQKSNSSTSSTTNDGVGGIGSFSITINELSPNSLYYYKAFAINDQNQWIFGEKLSFTTKSVSD